MTREELLTTYERYDRARWNPFEFPGHSATSERLACSVGGESHRGKSRSPVAWVASVEETKRMKPTDKAVLGAVSALPGRNEKLNPRGRNRPCFPPGFVTSSLGMWLLSARHAALSHRAM